MEVSDLVLLGQKNFPVQQTDGNVHGRKDRSDPPFFANGVPAWMNTNETVYVPVGRKPGRSRGTRLPSGARTGFTFSPSTSADKMLAPGGRETFRKGWAWFFSNSLISVSERPSEVTRVVTCALSATAASTLLSGNRTHSSANVGPSLGWR